MRFTPLGKVGGGTQKNKNIVQGLFIHHLGVLMLRDAISSSDLKIFQKYHHKMLIYGYTYGISHVEALNEFWKN